MSLKSHSIRNDRFAKLAKQQGYVSRAAFKLVSIDQKFKLFNPVSKRLPLNVIDLGASPGGWTQVLAKKTHISRVIGIDLNPLHHSIQNNNKVHFIQKDILQWNYFETIQDLIIMDNKNECGLISSHFNGIDHIISDIAPNITGIKQVDFEQCYELHLCVLDIAMDVLKHAKQSESSSMVIKTFDYLGLCSKTKSLLKQHFRNVHEFKPESSRSISSERYLICQGLFNIQDYPRFFDDINITNKNTHHNNDTNNNNLMVDPQLWKESIQRLDHKIQSRKKNKNQPDDPSGKLISSMGSKSVLSGLIK